MALWWIHGLDSLVTKIRDKRKVHIRINELEREKIQAEQRENSRFRLQDSDYRKHGGDFREEKKGRCEEDAPREVAGSPPLRVRLSSISRSGGATEIYGKIALGLASEVEFTTVRETNPRDPRIRISIAHYSSPALPPEIGCLRQSTRMNKLLCRPCSHHKLIKKHSSGAGGRNTV
jgi:hypothetical protein